MKSVLLVLEQEQNQEHIQKLALFVEEKEL